MVPVEESELTESGRPRVARPMPDHSGATRCPHCGEEVGMGHYVCWNCSKDIRMQAQTEADILDEYHAMVAGEEMRLERRNRRFFFVLIGLLVVLAAANLLLGGRLGTSVLFLLLGIFPAYWVVKATRRMGRIERAGQQEP